MNVMETEKRDTKMYFSSSINENAQESFRSIFKQFLIGFASTFNLVGNFYETSKKTYTRLPDWEKLGNDWNKIGGDLRTALNKTERQNKMLTNG